MNETGNFIDFKGIRFRTWIYFTLMAVIILGVLWAMQVVFFNAYYQSMKKNEIERVGNKLIERYGSDNYDLYVRDTAFNNGLSILLFTGSLENQLFTLKEIKPSSSYYGNSVNEAPLETHQFVEFLNKLYSSKNHSVSYISEGIRNKTTLVYGSIINDGHEDVYFYLTSSLLPVDASTSVLGNQLLIVTIICLLLSIILSWFISSRLSKPITEFSRVARSLAKGNYNVKFIGNGYTEIDELAQTLNYATEEMGKTDNLRKDLIANVSHDLRTPLTMVKAYAEMIRDISGKDEKKRNSHSQVIIDEADRLTNLVNDILNLSKLQAGTESLAVSKVDLSSLGKTVLERFDIMRERDGFNFILECEEEIVVHGDSAKLEQVLYNLISNAVNYTGENKNVKLKIFKRDKSARVEVIDSGKGIAKEDISTIWERYYRVNEHKRSVVGTGLGLSIVKNILLAHNAKFGVESEVGKGSTFWFEMEFVG